jgi:hypothetical protein
MKKLAAYVGLVLAAIAVAAAYGILHDQASFTVSPEYFTRFKFPMFGLAQSPMPNRFNASVVGFEASWWMGIPIGLLVGAAGFMQPGWREMVRVTLKSYGVVVATAMLTAAVGLAYGMWRTRHIDLGDYQGWYVPEGLEDTRRFLCAGYMHNSSYLGGLLGIVAAWAYQLRVRLGTARAPR